MEGRANKAESFLAILRFYGYRCIYTDTNLARLRPRVALLSTMTETVWFYDILFRGMPATQVIDVQATCN